MDESNLLLQKNITSHEDFDPHLFSTNLNIRKISSMPYHKKLKVLMVDDQIFNLIILEELLNSL
jgi:hypothetical protein